MPPAVGLDVVGDALLAFGHGQAIEWAGVYLRPVLHVSLLQVAAVPTRRRDDDSYVQAVLRRKLEIPLVVGGNAHHDSRAVG